MSLIDETRAPRVTFLWGLKRSGIHHLVNWLYANLGASRKEELPLKGLHPQLVEGYCDPTAGVAFFNNCGRTHSRQFALGDLESTDFDRAAASRRATIFGIEDCALELVSPATAVRDAVHVLVLRDPLNNIASRLAAQETRPEVFRVDDGYLDLLESYCAEFLGRSSALPHKTVVNFNRFVAERSHRDALAASLGLSNADVVSEVSEYGGGSSFSDGALTPASLANRFRQHPIPRPIVESLLARAVVREACSTLFGYDLAELGAEL